MSQMKQCRGRDKVAAGYVQMAQRTAAESNRPDHAAIAEGAGQTEGAQVRESADGLRQDLRGELMCAREVQTPQTLRQRTGDITK